MVFGISNIMPAWITPKRGRPESHDPKFKGPVEKRSATDILFLILFVIAVIVWAVVLFYAAVRSDTGRLIRPTDSAGNVCGRDSEVKDKPYLLFFDITRCASPKVAFTGCPTPQICVENCPKANWIATEDSIPKRENLYCKYDVQIDGNTNYKQLFIEDKCASYQLASSSIANRCIPRNLSLNANEILDNVFWKGSMVDSDKKFTNIVEGVQYLSRFVKIQEVVEGAMFDIKQLWYLILALCGVAMVLSLVWIALMRFFAKFMVGVSLVGFIGLFGYGAYFTMNKYLEIERKQDDRQAMMSEQLGVTLNDSPELNKKMWLWAFIAIVVIFFICLLLIVFLRSRISIAIELIKEASKAVAVVPQTLFFPTVPYILQIFCIVLFCATAAMLASVGHREYRVYCHGNCDCPGINENATCTPGEFNPISCPGSMISCQFYSHRVHNYIVALQTSAFQGIKISSTYLQIFNLFMLFWTICFVEAFEDMTLAGTFSTWYWKNNKEPMPSGSVGSSFYRTVRYHMGTLAIGSLVIAIVKTLRVLFEYINYQLKKYTDNSIAKCIACCCRCCLWCLENFLRFVNRNAYIYCAIYGKNFCTSARKSFNLLMRNVARVVVLDKVADLLLFIGKLVITAAMTLLTFSLFSQEFVDLRNNLPEYRYYWTPVLIVTIATFFIASSFFSVYSMAVDTLFLCFLEDCERNDGSVEKPYKMSKHLMKILSKENKVVDDDNHDG